MSSNSSLGRTRLNTLEKVDALPIELRQCVHEFGYPTVSVLMKFGVSNPKHIREIVYQIWLGPRDRAQTNGTLSAVDFILQRGPVDSIMLNNLLEYNNLKIIPTEPTKAMVEASIQTVANHDLRITKYEKHRRRLIAAVKAFTRIKA